MAILAHLRHTCLGEPRRFGIAWEQGTRQLLASADTARGTEEKLDQLQKLREELEQNLEGSSGVPSRTDAATPTHFKAQPMKTRGSRNWPRAKNRRNPRVPKNVSKLRPMTETTMAQPKPIDHTTGRDYQLPRSQGPILTPEESRQGVVSGRVLMILTTSLVLALIAFVILYTTEIV